MAYSISVIIILDFALANPNPGDLDGDIGDIYLIHQIRGTR